MDLLAPYLENSACASRLTDDEIDEQVTCLTELAVTPAAAKCTLPAAFALIASSPSDPRPQLLAATLLERSRVRDHMCETWAALFDRFPQLDTALRYWVRWLNRQGKTDEAVSLLQKLFEDGVETDEDLVAQAELYSEIRDPGAADTLFGQLVGRHPDNVRIRVIYGKSLFARGDILRAFEILDPVRGQRLSPTAKAVVERNDRAILAMETIRPDSAKSYPTGPDALFNAVSLFAHRKTREISDASIDGISFYTGSLGAGGAERQLTQIASALHQRSRTGRNIAGTTITGRVDVIVNTIDASRGKDFFQKALQATGVPLSITQDMPAKPKAALPSHLEILEDLLPILPPNSRFGLERLVVHLQHQCPDVLYIWQDGAVLTGALAALVAGVPRIAISLRGLPPNLRPHLMKPEYRKLYQALVDVPGVTFSCNSKRAAEEYCNWLGLEKDRFSVLYNALMPLPTEPAHEDTALWDAFDNRTADAEFTLGSVFRMTPNKRGLLWIDYAAEVFRRHPKSRFVLVGDGDEWDALQAKAKLLGIADRTLFVGRTNSPGYWYKKMDAVALLSENEGLPNVLIEAQIFGKPVISTPAGGAQETFTPGRTGYLMSSATNPSQTEFMGFITHLIGHPDHRAAMGKAATQLAQSRFAFDNILGQTVRHFHGAHISPETDRPSNVTHLPRQIASTVAAPRVRDAYNIFASS